MTSRSSWNGIPSRRRDAPGRVRPALLPYCQHRAEESIQVLWTQAGGRYPTHQMDAPEAVEGERSAEPNEQGAVTVGDVTR